jgi:hypothetical protein
LPEDSATPFHAGLGPDGRLWIPAELRKKSVMLRVENGVINMYLRKVFETRGADTRVCRADTHVGARQSALGMSSSLEVKVFYPT